MYVTQNEIQRRGGICSKYPVSCLIRDMLVESGVIRPFKPIRVLDLTFGEGRFWPAVPQAQVVGFDIRKLKWHFVPRNFFLESCENWKSRVGNCKFDLIVADPPFILKVKNNEIRKHYKEENIVRILREADKAAKYFNAQLLVHFIWKAVPYGFEVVTERWFRPLWRNVVIKGDYVSWFGVLKLRNE